MEIRFVVGLVMIVASTFIYWACMILPNVLHFKRMYHEAYCIFMQVFQVPEILDGYMQTPVNVNYDYVYEGYDNIDVILRSFNRKVQEAEVAYNRMPKFISSMKSIREKYLSLEEFAPKVGPNYVRALNRMRET